jgi:tetratricopeptide (TPR) repeat protein
MLRPAKLHRLWITCLLAIAALCNSSISRANPIGYQAPGPHGTPSDSMAQAVGLLGQGKLKEADALLLKETNSNPADLDAALGRAQIAIGERQLNTADQMVTAVLKRQNNLPEAHNMKGLVLLLRKDSPGAQREFTRAIELRPQYITPHLYLAAMARVAGDFSGAATEYRKIIAIAPHLPTGYLGEAEAETMLHREPDALRILESWKTADPRTLLPYQVLANIDISDHKPQLAMQQLQAALAKSPHDSTTLAILGGAYEAAGDNHSAATQYQAALAANPANADAAIRLGTLEAASGSSGPALAHFRQALKTDPNNAIACNDAAWLLEEQGKNLDEAQRLAQLAVTRDPKYADAHDTLGWVLYRRGNYLHAVAMLKQAKTLAPASPDVAAHLGLAYAKTGHKQEALAEINRALKSGASPSIRPELEHTAAQLSAR